MAYIILGIGLAFLILEIFVPTMFFLNFAFAAFICAIISLFFTNIYGLVAIFCILSLILILAIRPIFVKKPTKKEKTGMEAKYVGNTAVVVEDIDKNKGVISIYDERWQARTKDDTVIEKGQSVEIIGYNSLIMQVKKID